MKIPGVKRLVLTLAGSALLPLLAMAQLPADPGDSSSVAVSTSTGIPATPLTNHAGSYFHFVRFDLIIRL